MFFWNITIQIQTRHVTNHKRKENTTISLMDWKIIMFNHEGVKTMKARVWKWFEVFQSSIHMSNLKCWLPKKYEGKGPNMHNPNQFMASQNPLYNNF